MCASTLVVRWRTFLGYTTETRLTDAALRDLFVGLSRDFLSACLPSAEAEAQTKPLEKLSLQD